MLDFLRRHRTAWAVAVFFVVAVALLLLERGGADQPMGPLGSVTFAAAATAQNASANAGQGAAGLFDRYFDLVAVHEQNRALQAELDRLRDENVRLLGVMQQNERLRALVGFRDAYPRLDLVPAHVVARDVSPWFRVNTIRIEPAQQVITVGMPVVSSAGVVGFVSEVADRFAQVTLTVDPRSSVDVVVQRNRARGVLIGLGHETDYDARVAYLLRRDEVVPGDVIVTSGEDGRYPADLAVGRIRAVVRRDFGLFQEVLVEPAVDFSRVEEVFVITGQSR